MPPGRPRLLALLLCAALPLAFPVGCSRPQPDPARAFFDVSEVPISGELRPAVESWRRALRRDPPPGQGDAAVEAYESFAVGIQRPATRSASGDSLYRRWRADPTHFLWIELGCAYNYLLRRNADRNQMYALPALSDTNSAVGAFVQGRRFYRYGSRGQPYVRADSLAAGLDPLQRAWLTLKVAMVDADRGQPLVAVRRLLDRLPAARSAGGERLVGLYWRDIALYLQRADRLDDALHAAAVAGASALTCGAAERALAVRAMLADILASRSETTAALAAFDACLREAATSDYPWLLTDLLNRAAALSGTAGDLPRALEYDRRSVAHSLSVGDSLNAPRNMMNVAHDLRVMGALDSCRVWQLRARRWVEAFHDARNLARLPLLEAEYFCQIGDYRTADSLLAVARGRLPGASLAIDEAELLLAQIRQGIESGQPRLAYRAIGRLAELRPALYDRLPDRNLIVDYEIATAGFLAAQGELAAAHAALGRAATALSARGGEGRTWELERAAGELARLREDPLEAQRAFTACLDWARQARDPQRLATSRLLLGRTLLDAGRPVEARALFRPPGAPEDTVFGGGFRARMSTLVFLGHSYTSEGRPAEALEPLRRARALCTSYTPVDLLARVWLETGRAQAAAGDARAAEASLLQARGYLPARLARSPQPELAAFTDETPRELAEALVSLYVDHPTLMPKGRLGVGTLELARGLLEHDLEHDLDRPGHREPAAKGHLAAARAPVADRRVDASHPPRGPSVVHLVGRDRTFQWVIAADGVTLATLPGRTALRASIAPVLADMQTPGRPLDPAATLRLSSLLLGNVGPRWHAGQTLTLALDDLLAAVPWAALPLPEVGGGRHPTCVLEHGPVAEAVYAGVPLSDLTGPSRDERARPGAEDRLLAIGNDQPVPPAPEPGALPALRHAEVEARRIAELWPAGRSVLRVGSQSQATVASSTSGWSDFDVIHVASHAVVRRGERARSTLRIAGSADPVPLTLPDVASASLNARLVYLSCCEAAGRLAGEGVTDFARAFLRAGVGAVIASSLPVDDEAAAFLAERFYTHWMSGHAAADALRAAQLDVRAARSEWEHPAYWAFYRLVEQGG